MEVFSPDNQSAAPLIKPTKSRKIIVAVLSVFSVLLLCIAIVIWWKTTAPTTFVSDATLTIASGASVQQIANQAAAEGLVRSPLLLYATLLLRYEPQDIFAGTYVLEGPMNVFAVAEQLASKQTKLDLIKITLPEGLRATYMAAIITDASSVITEEAYVEAATQLEGYLFPETYLIPPTMTARELVTLQTETFEETYEQLQRSSPTSTFSKAEVVTLASIVEREANDQTSMKMVAGVFMNRLAIGMPLQADASIEYALDVPINELRAGELAVELRELDSPYNTYFNPGLPPTPIGNPGRQALAAVLNPTPSDYFYYITGDDGEFYYAETLQQHNLNIERHLR